jgi:hypothetical protein
MYDRLGMSILRAHQDPLSDSSREVRSGRIVRSPTMIGGAADLVTKITDRHPAGIQHPAAVFASPSSCFWIRAADPEGRIRVPGKDASGTVTVGTPPIDRAAIIRTPFGTATSILRPGVIPQTLILRMKPSASPDRRLGLTDRVPKFSTPTHSHSSRSSRTFSSVNPIPCPATSDSFRTGCTDVHVVRSRA